LASPTACILSAATFSGGQEQRVTIARAIVSDSDILLCGRADRRPRPQKRDGNHALVEELVAKHGKTVLMVTHDPVVAAARPHNDAAS